MPGTVRTKGGRILSEADLERLASSVEHDLDISSWKPRPGRPPLDSTATAHAPRIAVRVPEELHRRAVERATREGRTMSEVVRDLLEGYARDPAASRPSPAGRLR
jgi:predicted HicB family RNase H-like nuclease